MEPKAVGIVVILFCGFVSYSQGDSYGKHNGLQRHINSVASSSVGCQKKPYENIPLVGGAKACSTAKPLKLTKVLKTGKQLCAANWDVCSIEDKYMKKLSWKVHKMPKGCFAFNYGKSKAAGYGKSCQSNLYFDGVLCCPQPGSKSAHKIKSGYNLNKDKFSHKLNLV